MKLQMLITSNDAAPPPADLFSPGLPEVVGFRVILGFHTVYYEYHFINTDMTWPAAQEYCRLHYHDLATFTSMDDIQRVNRPSPYAYAWIGLIDDLPSWYRIMGNESNSWVWSATGTTSPGGFQGPWETGEPDFNSANNACVMMRNGFWADDNCMNTNTNYFVCFTGSLKPGSKEFILVESFLSWSDAQNYCREHYVDLAIIEDESDFNTVVNLIGGYWVWIGLSRQPYRWSDNRISNFKNWIGGEPDNKQGNEHCVMENPDPEHLWLDAWCEAPLKVICQQACNLPVNCLPNAPLTEDTIIRDGT
ncbi:hypothetical protein WMY93_026996 [Mugilogobius chulae]|uniref:C-type lectin domain-containing protein n=1 Tax=Mugilogobius chulae TaxID=88201 RepID=A0AAW0MWB6_9GOBI